MCVCVCKYIVIIIIYTRNVVITSTVERNRDAGKHQYPISTGNITRQHIYVVYIKGPINPNMKKDTRPPRHCRRRRYPLTFLMPKAAIKVDDRCVRSVLIIYVCVYVYNILY